MNFALENCTNYVDVTRLTIIVIILLYTAFIAIWIVPVYLLRKRGFIIKLLWIFILGLILNFFYSMNALSLSQALCNRGPNTDFLDKVNGYVNSFITAYATLIQPVLLLVIVVLAVVGLTKLIQSRLKALYVKNKS